MKLKILSLAIIFVLITIVFNSQTYAQETCEWTGGHHVCYSDLGCTPGMPCTSAASCSCFPDDSPDGAYCGHIYVDGHCDWCGGSAGQDNCAWLAYNECADSCGGAGSDPCWAAARAHIYVFEDYDEDGLWDNNEPQVPLGVGDPRIQGATLSWVGGSGGGGSGSLNEGEGLRDNPRGAEGHSEIPDSCPLEEANCGDSWCSVKGRCVPIDINLNSFDGSFDACRLINLSWGGYSGCENAVQWNPNYFWSPVVTLYDCFSHSVVFRLDVPEGNGYAPTRETITNFMKTPPGGGKVHRSAIAFGIKSICVGSICHPLGYSSIVDMNDSRSGFECSESFGGWRANGTATQTVERSDEQAKSGGSYSLKVDYQGISSYFTAYTVLRSAPLVGEQVRFWGNYKVTGKTGDPKLRICIQHWKDHSGGEGFGEDCFNLSSAIDGWKTFDVISPNIDPDENNIIFQFVSSGDSDDDNLVYFVDDLCAEYEEITITPTPTLTPTPTPTPTPAPLCTIDLSPPLATIHQGEEASLWIDTAILNGTLSRIELTSSDPEIATVQSAPDPDFAIVSGIAQGGPVTITAKIYLNPGDFLGCSNISKITVTYADPWFQTLGGDVYSHGGISSSIPQACVDDPECEAYFSLVLEGYSGLISSPQGTSRSFDRGTATESNDDDWSIDGSSQAVISRYSYSYFAHQADTACKEGEGANNSFNPEVNCLYGEVSVSFPSSEGITVYNVGSQNVSLSGGTWSIGNDSTIVFVNFDGSGHTLSIDEDITVGSSGFFALITNGDIEIKQGTSGVASIDPQLQGVYIADGQIRTDTDTTKFVGEGIFYAKNGFDLKRDLEKSNATYPAELFIFNPQYLFTAPQVFREKPYLWRELVP